MPRQPSRTKQRAGSGRSRTEQNLRLAIAEAAARMLATNEARNFHAAKQKAAARLGVTDARNLPSNEEVEAALLSYQRLFHGEEHALRVRKLREAAVRSMRFFERFSPRLVGAVLQGTATQSAEVHLHLFAEPAEEVELFLAEQRIPFEQGQKRLVAGNGEFIIVPSLSFIAQDTPFDLTIFPPNSLREAPRASRDGSPIERASVHAVEALIATE
jgi:hypothetical protein